MKTLFIILKAFMLWSGSGALGMHFEIPDAHLVFAKDEITALHEVGHIAYEHSFEFNETVDLYIENIKSCSEINDFIQSNRYEEIYAELYALYILSKIPIEFDGFY